MSPDIEQQQPSEAHGRTEEIHGEDGATILKKFDESGDVTRPARVEFKRKEGRVFVKVKAGIEWENWLKATRTVKTRTEGVFKNPGEFRFYSGTLPTRGIRVAGFDNLEGEMFFFDSGSDAWFFNLAVFRLEGISRGVTLECAELVPGDEVGRAIRNSLKIVERIYSDYIRKLSVVVDMRVA